MTCHCVGRRTHYISQDNRSRCQQAREEIEFNQGIMACKCVLALVGTYFLAFVSHAVGSCNFNSDCTSYGSYCCGGKCTYSACSYTTSCGTSSDCPGAKYCCASGDYRYDLSDCPLWRNYSGTYSSGWYHSGMRCLLCLCCIPHIDREELLLHGTCRAQAHTL